MAKREKKEKKRKKTNWKGVLVDQPRRVRLITAIMLVLLSAALVFTQLGFAGIGASGEYTVYIVVLLLPIALAALHLGVLGGTGVGLVAGCLLYAHSLAMPLNSYELSFITPLTSIVQLGVAGLLLGWMFGFALRNNPSNLKRVVYIIIISIVVSWLYSFGFVVNVVISMLQSYADQLANGANAEAIQDSMAPAVIAMSVRLGNMTAQAWADAALMAIFCITSDFAARKASVASQNMGLRGLFAVRLSFVVMGVFLVMAPISFVAITQGEINDASESMKSEAGYLCKQLAAADSRANSVVDLLKQAKVDLSGLSDQEVDTLYRAVSTDTLLDGYSKEEDGTIFILVPNVELSGDGQSVEENGYMIFLSDDEDFPRNAKINDLVSLDFVKAIETSVETGKMRRTVYDDTGGKSIEDILENGDNVNSEIVYLCAQAQDEQTVVVVHNDRMVFKSRNATMAWVTLSMLIVLIVVFILVARLLDRAVARRIDETNGVLERITKGDLNARVNVVDTREFKSLSGGINETVDALKGWIAEAESRMDAELATAKAIQESALPRTFPPFPDIMKFDVYASMNAAREVGGDFYDFFLIGSESDSEGGTLGFIMADVSGKGVPAALFMMKSMTLVRDYLQNGMEVGEAVENANSQLCDGNDAGMFVTMWVGVLDYGTGHVDYVNAGHNPPLLWQKDGWRWLTEKSGMPLGLFDGFPYGSFSVDCAIGDQFLLYTDGVTEAMSVEGELYGEDRLIALAEENFTAHPHRLVDTVRRDVAIHARGAEQSDDITILALEVGVPPEVTATIVVPARRDELPNVNRFIHDELNRRLCPLRAQNQLDIAVEELFVNVCCYAYPDATPENPGNVRVSYTSHSEPPSIVVDIADDGIPYNPLEKPDAVTPDNIEDVPIGGLGILMAKRSVNNMSYERTDGANIVTITKKW